MLLLHSAILRMHIKLYKRLVMRKCSVDATLEHTLQTVGISLLRIQMAKCAGGHALIVATMKQIVIIVLNRKIVQNLQQIMLMQPVQKQIPQLVNRVQLRMERKSLKMNPAILYWTY